MCVVNIKLFSKNSFRRCFKRDNAATLAGSCFIWLLRLKTSNFVCICTQKVKFFKLALKRKVKTVVSLVILCRFKNLSASNWNYLLTLELKGCFFSETYVARLLRCDILNGLCCWLLFKIELNLNSYCIQNSAVDIYIKAYPPYIM